MYSDTSTPATVEMALSQVRLQTSASSLAQIEEKEKRKHVEQGECKKERKKRGLQEQE